MKLVPDYKEACKWFSMHAMFYAAALPFAWAQMPPELKAYIPAEYMPYITAGILIGGMFGRVIQQKGGKT